MEIINLNLIPTGTRPVVHASQYDNGRQFRANLFEGASVYTLTGAETLTFSVRKPDGHIVTEGVTNTSDNYVVIETTTQMCACAGDSFAELKIENGDDLIGTLNLILAVEQSPEEGGDPSESFIHNLEQQIYDAVADQYDADSVIFDNTPTAGHGVGFAVTSEGVKDAIDNAIGGLSIPDELNDLSDVAITTPSNGEILVYNNGTWENQANPSSTTNFAPDYDDTATYNTNDKVIYQGLLYVCLEDSVTGAWDNTKWQQISVADYNATLLPIQSGSATNTKDYIDTGLSGKADKTVTTGSLSVITGVSITLARSQLVRFGNIAFITFAISATANITSGTDLLKASSGFSAIVLTDFIGVDNNDNGKPFYISGDKITANRNLTSGGTYFVNAWYRLA